MLKLYRYWKKRKKKIEKKNPETFEKYQEKIEKNWIK